MKFIELTGATLAEIVKEDELHAADLSSAGIQPESIVRINEQGDIELRRQEGWDVVGGLLGEFVERVSRTSGLDWA
jgi:hypothetical protein